MASSGAQQTADAFTFHPALSQFSIPQQTYLATHPDPRYSYIAIGAIVLDRSEPSEPRVLLLQRASGDSMPDRWEIPGGGCDDEDESILHAAARELREETGLTATRIGPQVGDAHLFTSRSGKKICKFTFVADVEGTVEKRPPAVKLDPEEHQQYIWATQKEVEAGMVGELKLEFTTSEVQEAVLAAFSLGREPLVDGLGHDAT